MSLLMIMKFAMTFNMIKLQTVNHLLENANQRWKSFMNTKDDWMFNFYTDDDGPIETRWKRLNAIKAVLVKKGNAIVQIKRSRAEQSMKSTEVFNVKGAFKN